MQEQQKGEGEREEQYRRYYYPTDIDDRGDITSNNMFVILTKDGRFVKRFIICINQASPFYNDYNEGQLKPLNVREVGVTTNSLGLDDITYDVIGNDSCTIEQFELVFVERFGFRLIEKY